MRKLSFLLALFCSIALAQTALADDATKEVTIAIMGMT